MSTLEWFRRVIQGIPRGKVATYGQVAFAAGFPHAARLTVRALNNEEDLPWHRVVGAGGRIALQGADGAEQQLRLSMEGVTFRGGRVRMDLHGWTPPARSKRRPRGASTRRTSPDREGFRPERSRPPWQRGPDRKRPRDALRRPG